MASRVVVTLATEYELKVASRQNKTVTTYDDIGGLTDEVEVDRACV
jgi:hypothetical protein